MATAKRTLRRFIDAKIERINDDTGEYILNAFDSDKFITVVLCVNGKTMTVGRYNHENKCEVTKVNRELNLLRKVLTLTVYGRIGGQDESESESYPELRTISGGPRTRPIL